MPSNLGPWFLFIFWYNIATRRVMITSIRRQHAYVFRKVIDQESTDKGVSQLTSTGSGQAAALWSQNSAPPLVITTRVG